MTSIRYFTLLCLLQLIQLTRSDHMPWSFWVGGMINDLHIRWKDQCPGCISQGLEVSFVANGQAFQDHVCLELTTGCVYQGYFQHDETATPVVVTKGCPNQDPLVIETSFKCQAIEGFTFMSLISDGMTVSPHYAIKDMIHEDKELMPSNSSSNLRVISVISGRTTFPTYGFELDAVVLYDDGFRNGLHSGNDANAITQIQAVMAHVQTFYNLPSLGTTIKINVKRIERAAGETWVADTDSEKVRTYVNALSGDTDIDAFIIMSYRNNQAGTTGIAYTGTACESEKGLRTSINEWTTSDTVTAETVAHELGHNLNMMHDFTSDSDGAKVATPYRYCTIESPPNNQCTEIGSLMDYYQAKVDKWSCCSREDFTTLYNQVLAAQGSFCLAPGSAPATTTVAPTTEVTEPPVFPDRFLRGIIELVALFLGSQIPEGLAEVMRRELVLLALNLRQLGVS